MENLSNRLVGKSVEAFIMGLEIYNKPTIRYRVEGFSFFICNAWELMLKAYLINRDGETSIYYADKADRTISLEESIKRVFTNKHDPLRLNLEQIISLRNTSTHFITEDYEQIFAPLFQACVFNYVEKMQEFHTVDVSKNIAPSFLSLSVNVSDISDKALKANYSAVVAERMIRKKKVIFFWMFRNLYWKFFLRKRKNMTVQRKWRFTGKRKSRSAGLQTGERDRLKFIH